MCRSAPRSLIPLSDYGREAPHHLQGLGLHQSRCGFNLRIDNGEISFGRAIGQSKSENMPPVPSLPSSPAAWDQQRRVRAGVGLATLMETAGPRGRRRAGATLPDRASPGRAGRRGPGQQRRRRLGHGPGAPSRSACRSGSRRARRAARSCASGWPGWPGAEGVREVAPDGPWPGVGIAVDALLGTGAVRARRGPQSRRCSSGCTTLGCRSSPWTGRPGSTSATGAVHGAARADLTVTFGGFRRGHLLARDEVGDIVVVDIGHPPAPAEWPALVTDAERPQWLPRAPAADHKGAAAAWWCVGGAPGMTGALRLAARAAFAAGAGLVHAVAPAETIAALVQARARPSDPRAIVRPAPPTPPRGNSSPGPMPS